MEQRKMELMKLIPKDTETILDIGSGEGIFDEFKTIRLDLKNADINLDLNKSQKIPLKDKEVDMTILSQILEHLVTVEEIIKESKRISKKYILVGLPNELKLDNRIRYLLGIPTFWGRIDDGYYPYGHKHFFTIKRIELFVKRFFGKYKKRYFLFGVAGGRFIPLGIRRILARFLPSLFAGEVYYLIGEKMTYCKSFQHKRKKK